ncbi:MAG TPA: alanine racemase, partial [Tepidisphaeraceae bacterium]|nr:alanine racemase [Tepidisphaeraceae bacterium]
MKNAARITVDLEAIRSNALAIRERVGVDVIGVVKADAYGCGLRQVVEAIDEVVSGWYVLHPREAIEGRLSDVSSKPVSAGAPVFDENVDEL